jgi:hypothetical protein
LEEFLRNLTNPAWLLSVVVVGLVINIIGHFLARRIDSWLVRTSSWWRNRSQARLAQEAKIVERLLSDKDEEMLFRVREMRDHLSSGIALLMALILVGFIAAILKVFPDSRQLYILSDGLILLTALLVFVTVGAQSRITSMNLILRKVDEIKKEREDLSRQVREKEK